MYDFDKGVDRLHTNCHKWDHLKDEFGFDDMIAVSVADMDFAAPETVSKAICERAMHGAFGYTYTTKEDTDAVINWMKRRHATDIQADWILSSPGVVDSMRVAVAAYTKPGDKVACFTPVYPPFYGSIEAAACVTRSVPLLHDESGWKPDFDELEKAFKEGAAMLLMCSPHNPVGRIWTKDELTQIAAIAKKYNKPIVCDEIHGDLEMPGYKQTCMLNIDPSATVFISATKTFNLAALRHSSVLIADPDRRKLFSQEYNKRGIDGINLFGALAQKVAYQTGDEWLDSLMQYLDGNRQTAEDFFRAELPDIGFSRVEGTYLMWLDMRSRFKTAEELMDCMHKKARIDPVDGKIFGGEGFLRLNLATPRKNIVTALERIKNALN